MGMVFSAEVISVLRCTELLLAKNIMRRRIHICSDSRAALAGLEKLLPNSFLFGNACKRWKIK